MDLEGSRVGVDGRFLVAEQWRRMGDVIFYSGKLVFLV